MIAALVWHLKALAWRIVGVWERRGMRRQPAPCDRCGLTYCIGPRCPLDMPPDPPPAPRVVIVVTAPAPTVRVDLDGRVVELTEEQITRLELMRRSEHET